MAWVYSMWILFLETLWNIRHQHDHGKSKLKIFLQQDETVRFIGLFHAIEGHIPQLAIPLAELKSSTTSAWPYRPYHEIESSQVEICWNSCKSKMNLQMCCGMLPERTKMDKSTSVLSFKHVPSVYTCPRNLEWWHDMTWHDKVFYVQLCILLSSYITIIAWCARHATSHCSQVSCRWQQV